MRNDADGALKAYKETIFQFEQILSHICEGKLAVQGADSWTKALDVFPQSAEIVGILQDLNERVFQFFFVIVLTAQVSELEAAPVEEDSMNIGKMVQETMKQVFEDADQLGRNQGESSTETPVVDIVPVKRKQPTQAGSPSKKRH